MLYIISQGNLNPTQTIQPTRLNACFYVWIKLRLEYLSLGMARIYCLEQNWLIFYQKLVSNRTKGL